MKAQQRAALALDVFSFLFVMLGLVLPNLLFVLIGGIFFIGIAIIFYNGMSYRPPDDCIVAIYRKGKVDQIIDSTQVVSTFLSDDKRTPPISLRMRQTHLTEPEVLTRDQQIVQITLHVYYSVDPRNANPALETEELQYSDDEWKNVIQREMQSVLIEVARSYYFNDLLTTDGLVRLRLELSSALADTVRDLGIAIHEAHGVRIDQLLPHRKILQAMIEADASTCLGEAAQKRLQPLMSAVGPNPAPGWQALLVTMASAIVNHDDPQRLEAAPKFAKTVGEVKDPSVGAPPPARP